MKKNGMVRKRYHYYRIKEIYLLKKVRNDYNIYWVFFIIGFTKDIHYKENFLKIAILCPIIIRQAINFLGTINLLA